MVNESQCNKKSLFCCVCSFCKRTVSLLLILALFPMCLAVPAMADEVDDSKWVELLDYGFSNSGSNSAIVSSGSKITYNTPSYSLLRQVDVVFTSSLPVTRLQIYINDNYAPDATLYSLGNGLYRATLNLGAWVTNVSLIPTFSQESQSIFNIISFKVSSVYTESSPINVIFGGSNGSEGIFSDKHFTNTGAIYQDFFIDSENSAWNGGFFNCVFQFNEDWQKYDYIDVTLGYGYGEIVSVSAEIDGVPLPVTVSPIYGFSEAPTWRSFSVRVDLRGVNHSSTGIPLLTVNGKAIVGTNSFGIYSAYGFIEVLDPSLWSFWFTKVSTWLSSGFSSVTTALSSIGTNINSWISAQTNAFTSSINSWGQSIVNAINSGVDRIVDAITGGGTGDDLKDGADQIGQAGSSLGENIGSIQDFEDQYFSQLDSNMGTIVSGGNLSGIVLPLAFVQRYTNMIVAGIPSNYMVIFTLPIMLGIFFYIVRHPIKAPRPDSSGDSVTRDVGRKEYE